jgi:tetratricopeptide (TPR) repeat protein/serine/threonine protein kinase
MEPIASLAAAAPTPPDTDDRTAAAVAPATQSIPQHTHVRGRFDDYEIITQIDRQTADCIEQDVGLVIPFPPGSGVLGVVTTRTENPRGKLSLGKGSSGLFCLARAVNSRQLFGVKISERGQRAEAEFAIQRALHGIPHLLQAIDFGRATVSSEETWGYQIVKVAGLGSVKQLCTMIQTLDDRELQQDLLYHIARGVLEGLGAMHRSGYYHLDPKPDNVVIDHNGEVLIIDFDCATHSSDGRINATSTDGDPHFLSPERWLASLADSPDSAHAWCSGAKSDAWNAGLLLWELAKKRLLLSREDIEPILQLPFEDLPELLQFELSGTEDSSRRARLRALVNLALDTLPNSGYWHLVRRLLAFDPTDRLCVEEALRHPWMESMQQKTRPNREAILLRLREMVQGVATAPVSPTPHALVYSPQTLPQISTANHVHRRELQALIRDRLLCSAKKTVLHGNPGAGKSQLATFMLTQPSVQDKYGLMLFFRDANSSEQIELQYLTLARELDLADGDTEFQEAFSQLRNYLEGQHKPWLIIFDNANDPELLSDYIIPSGGHTLITSRSANWSDMVRVGPMNEEEATLLAGTLLQREEPDVRHLCQELTHLPLAIAQACAFVRNRQTTVTDYLHLLRETPSVAARKERQDGHRELPYSIQTMYKLTFEVLREQNALPLLHQLACLASDDIPGDVIDQLAGGSPAKRLLVDNAMLSPSTPNSYVLHGLVQRFVLSILSKDETAAALRTAMIAVDAHYKPTPSSDAETSANRRLLKHGVALLRYRRQLDPLPLPLAAPTAATLRWVIDASISSGTVGRTVPLLEEMMALADRAWGGAGKEWADCLMTAGNSWHFLGKYEKALESYQEALAILEGASGEEQPDVAAVLSNIGSTLSAQGEHETAAGFQKRALAARKSTLGEDHPDVAACQVNLGMTLHFVGQYERGIKHLNRALATFRTSLGEYHPDMACCLNNLGSSRQAFGQTEIAMHHHRQALAIQRHSLGESHPELADSLNRLGIALVSLGQHRRAIKLFEKALTIQENSLGKDHPHLANSLSNLGTAWTELASPQSEREFVERQEIAVRCYERALDIQTDAVGEGHPQVAAILCNLANLMLDLKRPQLALDYFSRALAIQQASPNDCAPDIAASLSGIGSAAHQLARYDEALYCYERALRHEQRLLGEHHPDVAVSLGNIGLLRLDMGQREAAIGDLQRAYDMALASPDVGPDHPHARQIQKWLISAKKSPSLLEKLRDLR